MSLEDKKLCDKLIADILQQPNSQPQFIEMLRHFQDITG